MKPLGNLSGLLFVFLFIFAKPVLAVEKIIIDCQASKGDLSIQVRVFEEKVIAEISQGSSVKHICETKPEFENGKSFHSPFYRVNFNTMSKCKPQMSTALAKMIEPEMRINQSLFGKTLEITWAAFSKPMDCKIKTNNFESYFNSKSKK